MLHVRTVVASRPAAVTSTAQANALGSVVPSITSVATTTTLATTVAMAGVVLALDSGCS